MALRYFFNDFAAQAGLAFLRAAVGTGSGTICGPAGGTQPLSQQLPG